MDGRGRACRLTSAMNLDHVSPSLSCGLVFGLLGCTRRRKSMSPDSLDCTRSVLSTTVKGSRPASDRPSTSFRIFFDHSFHHPFIFFDPRWGRSYASSIALAALHSFSPLRNDSGWPWATALNCIHLSARLLKSSAGCGAPHSRPEPRHCSRRTRSRLDTSEN